MNKQFASSLPKTFSGIFIILLTASLVACQSGNSQNTNKYEANKIAPGAPGQASTWAYSGKTGIGTSYERYKNGAFSQAADTGPVSKVWFSLSQGILTETMFGLIHEAQLKEMQFFIQGSDFFDEEKTDTESRIEYLHTDQDGRPLSLAYKVTNRDKDGKYTIEKHFFTDPDQNSLMMKVIFTAHEDGLTPYLFLNPHTANTGEYDKAWQAQNTWYAQDQQSEKKTTLALMTDAEVVKSTVGFVGVSDGITALRNGQPFEAYTSTGDTHGNVGITLQLPQPHGQSEWLFSLGFGDSPTQGKSAAQASLQRGYGEVLAHYNGEGEHIGWQDYLASLEHLPKLISQSTDNGKLLYTSALVIKAQEDKTHAGALIASLSNPWGDTKSASISKTGYKAVWPRDFYQVAMAMLALGDEQTPKVAFEYLKTVQVSDKTPGFSGAGGWFLQKTQVDGQLEWIAVQLDQTAMPIMLGWRLWQAGVFSDDEARHWYNAMLKPAAQFLSKGGKINFDWIDMTLTPPLTLQERWEEQRGYSPSSIAALISGLVCAAELAQLAGEDTDAQQYLEAADRYSGMLEEITFTTNGSLQQAPANGRYYLRVTQNQDPNDRAPLDVANAQVIEDESEIIDGGFLELVRYGVRSADDSHVVESLPELDNTDFAHEIRVKYLFRFDGVPGEFPGWRRYGRDGYGEDTKTGLGYGAINDQMSPNQRGRVWPFFTGERAHFELAQGTPREEIRKTYVKAMELFANAGMMLPEQVWDGVGNNSQYHYKKGEGTNSATPLAWTHAEYVKLLRSLHDKQVWDRYAPVQNRYVNSD